jgi:hypothetical protein
MTKLVPTLMALALTTVAASGCAIARAPVTGFIYTDAQAGNGVTSNQAGNRVGEACAKSYLGWIGTGDASIEAARRNGGITMISSVDEHAESILGVYAKYCTIVRGR